MAQQEHSSAIILKKELNPNHLIVQESPNDDNSAVELSQHKIDELQLHQGHFQFVLLRGKEGRETVCYFHRLENVPNQKIAINRCVRNNLGVQLGDIVIVQACPNIAFGKEIHILPIADTLEGVSRNFFDECVKRYFSESSRPVTEGDIFLAKGGTRPITEGETYLATLIGKGIGPVEFKVVKTDPSPHCIVAKDTEIKRDNEEASNKAGHGGSDSKKQSLIGSETAEDHEAPTAKQVAIQVAHGHQILLTPLCSTEPGDSDKKISEKLLLPKTKAEDIGNDGAKMDLLGCTLSLLPGAYPTPSPVDISVRSSYTDAPEGYIVASPELNCNNFGVPFKGLATITLPVHAIPEDGQVQIISKQDGNSDWEMMDVHPTLAGRKVTFQVSHFSPFKVIFKHIHWFNSYLSHYVFYRASTSELRGLTCIDDEKVKSDCIETLKEEGLRPWPLIPDPVVLYGNEEVTYKYTCLSPEGPRLKPVEVLKWVDVVPKKQNLFKFLPRPEQDIDIVDVKCVRTTLESESISILALQWRTPKREVHLGAGEIIPVAPKEKQMIVRPQGEEPRLGLHRLVGNVEITPSTQDFYELHHNAEDVYHIDPNRGKGKVLIFNNEFRGRVRDERHGSEVDVNNLRGLWNRMGFNVDVKINLCAEEMRRACKEFAAIAQNISVLVVIVMSHGGKENGVEFVTGEDGNKLYSDEITSYFTSTSCPRLRGIPKVIMFQACRGGQCDNIQQDANQEVQAIQARDPDRADMLIVYPSQSGSVSYRDPQLGSVLMNAVVNVFKRDAHDTHILDLLTKVNSEVAPEGGRVHSVQASNLVSFLRKKLFLFPGWP